MTQQITDPFALTGSAPSVSFKDAPVGTSFTGKVLEAPSLVQSKDYETGNPAFWPDGNPKMTVVTKLEIDGQERNLWAPKPSALFAAIATAQQAAGAQITVGGTLTVTYTGDKPNDNPRLHPAKQYQATYTPPDAFATPAAPAATTATPESIAALKAAGIDPAAVYPGAV